MPLNDERPGCAAGEGRGGDDDAESSGRTNSTTSSSDAECSRQSFTSDSSSKQSSPSSSPPRSITLDQVMESARDLSNLSLAHEIIVNGDFRVEKPDLLPNSLEKQVKDIVHKAFWDCLEAELNDDPPEYQHALSLLEEIREILLSFLRPGANRLRTQISEVLDMELIRQQADHGAVDIRGLALYVVAVMGKLCAPARDADLQRLRETPADPVVMFKEIFRVLDLMTMDMVNFTIQILRPDLQRQSVEFEQAKFQSIVEKTPSALEHTTCWIKASLREVLLHVPPAERPGEGKGVRALPSPLLVLNTGYIQLLTWDYQKQPLPETLLTDEVRLRELQRRLRLLQATACVLLIVCGAVGGPALSPPTLADRLKKMTGVLLEGIHSPDFNLPEALENVSDQICGELNRSLTGRDYPALSPELQVTLKGQIRSIAQENNPVRTLVEGRVQEYFRVVLSTPNAHVAPPPPPGGLDLIGAELVALARSYAGLVKFNVEVYSPFYLGVLKTLLFSDAVDNPARDSPASPEISNK